MALASMERCSVGGVAAAGANPAGSRQQQQCTCVLLQARQLRKQASAFTAAVAKSSLKAQRRSGPCRAVQSVLEDTALPANYVRYETMIVLSPDLTNEARDVQLAKFEAFLTGEDGKEINALVRGRQPLAYPIKGNWEGIYVLYTYVAPPNVSQAVQKMLSTAEVGQENTILRHMTFRQ